MFGRTCTISNARVFFSEQNKEMSSNYQYPYFQEKRDSQKRGLKLRSSVPHLHGFSWSD